jgi:CBS domain-containing protein
MSPRAAWRLETLGFTNVYDYVAGKADWFAAGLPREGRLAGIPRAGDIARRDDVTCQLTDQMSDVISKVRAAGKDSCVVTTDGNVVLGRVRPSNLAGETEATTEEVMDSGPTTTRTGTLLESILERLNARNVDSILVTTSDGRLVGTLHRSDAEARLNEGRAEESKTSMEESCCCCKD